MIKRFVISLIALMTAVPLLNAGLVLDINFDMWGDKVGGTDGADDGDRVQDVSGNGYHGFWGGGSAANNAEVLESVGGDIYVDNSDTAGQIILRDGLSSIPDAWDGGTTSTTPYFTLTGASSFTFEAIVNWNETESTTNGLLGKIGTSEVWWRERSGYLDYVLDDGPNRAERGSTIDVSAEKADGAWHHLAMVYDAENDEIRSYVDYELRYTDTAAAIANISGTMYNGTDDFYANSYNTTSGDRFNGYASHYRISDTVLSTDQFVTTDLIPEPATLGLVFGMAVVALIRKRLLK